MKNEIGYDARKGLGHADNVPVPSSEILNYAKEHGVLRFKGLTLHILTTIVVADVLMQEIHKANEGKPKKEQFDVNPDLVFETMIAYHSARPLAEDGVAHRANESINKYMEQHDDVELATLLGTLEHLPLSVIQEMEHLQYRRGFPDKTVGPANLYRPQTIDWNAAMTQVAGWSVTGTIQPIEKRFEDLITRHVGQPDSPKKLTREQLLYFQEWGKNRIADVCNHIGINSGDFNGFLRRKLFEGITDAENKSKNLIRELFGREAKNDEFLPVSPAYRYLSTSIMSIDLPRKQQEVERMLERPALFLRAARRYGLIDGASARIKS
ncbi:MAG: hypothetical protein Q7K54_04370 [Candidatus Parcubacteria bacterium]|nr:hypothetical protein [Candidatus Parcubacteria bacterium]